MINQVCKDDCLMRVMEFVPGGFNVNRETNVANGKSAIVISYEFSDNDDFENKTQKLLMENRLAKDKCDELYTEIAGLESLVNDLSKYKDYYDLEYQLRNGNLK